MWNHEHSQEIRNFLFIFILFGFLIIIYNFQNKSDTYVLATISNDSNQIHQQRKIVLLDLNKNKIIKELYSYNEGHTLEAAVSPDKRKLAVNKWTNHMDLNLFTIDLNTGKEFQLTNNINGEIERISWINNDEILYTFTSHNPKKDGLGTLIYVINTKTGRRRLIDGIEGLKAIYWYNTVKYIPQIKKIVMVRGLADDFFKPAINDTIHAPRNQLYLCDINGKNQKKLCC